MTSPYITEGMCRAKLPIRVEYVPGHDLPWGIFYLGEGHAFKLKYKAREQYISVRTRLEQTP